MIACRDPLGIRPLVMGRLGDAISSPAKPSRSTWSAPTFIRRSSRASCQVDFDGARSALHPPVRADVRPRPCIFEHVYFSRPDSILDGRRSTKCASDRRRAGPRNPVEADMVVPVPDSGVPAAIGYAQQSGIPFELGIIRSHYVGRTFIQPSDGDPPPAGVKRKHNANRALSPASASC
jgi:amidophosphoribosyltransferase